MKIKIKRKTVFGSLATICILGGMVAGARETNTWLSVLICAVLFILGFVFLYFGDMTILPRRKRGKHGKKE